MLPFKVPYDTFGLVKINMLKSNMFIHKFYDTFMINKLMFI